MHEELRCSVIEWARCPPWESLTGSLLHSIGFQSIHCATALHHDRRIQMSSRGMSYRLPCWEMWKIECNLPKSIRITSSSCAVGMVVIDDADDADLWGILAAEAPADNIRLNITTNTGLFIMDHCWWWSILWGTILNCYSIQFRRTIHLGHCYSHFTHCNPTESLINLKMLLLLTFCKKRKRRKGDV